MVEDDLIKAINKKYGAGAIQRFGSGIAAENVSVIPSGSIALDTAIGIGGYPRGRIVEILGNPSSGKAQPNFCKVLTVDGWKTIGSIAVGDTLISPTGGTTKVNGVFPKGVMDVYSVFMEDGGSTSCASDHLWEVFYDNAALVDAGFGSKRVEKGGVYVVDTPVLAHLAMEPFGPTYVRLALPTWETGNSELAVLDPKSVGIISANMCISENDDRLEFIVRKSGFGIDDKELSAEDLEKKILAAAKNVFGDEAQWEVVDHDDLKEYSAKITEEMDVIISYNFNVLWGEYLVPSEAYLIGDFETRAQLLAGMVVLSAPGDEDTTIIAVGEMVREEVADEMISLAVSVGVIPSVVDLSQAYPVYQFDLFGQFRKVREVRKASYRAECTCISVDNDDGLYITDDFIVTHNTTMALHAVAEAQKLGEKALFVDSEHALDTAYAASIGVDLEGMYISQPDYGEQGLQIAEEAIRSGVIGIVIVDSVAALVPLKELEGEIGDSFVGLQARMMSQACRKMSGVLKKSNALLIFINQYRASIGMSGYGGPSRVPSGGKALDYYSSIKLDVARTKSLSDKEGVVGANRTKVQVIKNKLAPPYRVAEFDIVFGLGINRLGEIIDCGIQVGAIEKGGAWYTIRGEKIQGREAVIEYLSENPRISDELEREVRERIKPEAGDSGE